MLEAFWQHRIDSFRVKLSQIEGKIVTISSWILHFFHRFTHYFVATDIYIIVNFWFGRVRLPLPISCDPCSMSWFASLFSLQKVATQFTLKHINQGWVEGCKVGWLRWCRRSDGAPEDKQANKKTNNKKMQQSNKQQNKTNQVSWLGQEEWRCSSKQCNSDLLKH